MILGVHHTCIIVSDREKAINFYQNVLGLKLLDTDEVGGEEVSRGVGVKNAKLKVALLEAGDDNIELIQYVSPKGKPNNGLPYDIGNMHIAFRVSDINKVYKELRKKGIRFNNPPIKVEEGPFKGWIWTYFKGPDGAQLELVEQH